MRKSREFFIRQQGFAVPNANPHLYSALRLQPRIIGGLAVLGSILQSQELFLLLSAVLAWGTIFLFLAKIVDSRGRGDSTF